jgi:hypothetical protein
LKNPAARRCIEHPLRYLNCTAGIALLECALIRRVSAFGDCSANEHRTVVPRMPPVENYSCLDTVCVLLSSCTTRSAATLGSATSPRWPTSSPSSREEILRRGLRISDIMKSCDKTRKAPDRSPAASRCVPSLLGHRMGSNPAGVGAGGTRREPTAERAGVDPRSCRRACQRSARGRRHPFCAPSGCRGSSELEAVAARPCRSACRPSSSETAGLSPLERKRQTVHETGATPPVYQRATERCGPESAHEAR